jgi:hypothetical protein
LVTADIIKLTLAEHLDISENTILIETLGPHSNDIKKSIKLQ